MKRNFIDRLKSVFKIKPKTNLTKVNLDQVNTPTPMHGNASGGSKGRAKPPGVEYKWKNVYPIKGAFRGGRGFLTQNKPY